MKTVNGRLGWLQWANCTRGRCDVIWEISHVNRNRTHKSKYRCLNKSNKINYAYICIYLHIHIYTYIYIHMLIAGICVQFLDFRLLKEANKIYGGRSVCRDHSSSSNGYWRASNNNTYTTTTIRSLPLPLSNASKIYQPEHQWQQQRQCDCGPLRLPTPLKIQERNCKKRCAATAPAINWLHS